MQAVSPCIVQSDYTPSGAFGFFHAASRAAFTYGDPFADYALAPALPTNHFTNPYLFFGRNGNVI